LRIKSSGPHFQAEKLVDLLILRGEEITGRSDFCRSRRNVSMPSMRGILISRMAKSGGAVLKTVERGGPSVGIGRDAIASASSAIDTEVRDIAVVVDESDCRHGGLANMSRPQQAPARPR